jgi:hypothetical protein
MSQEKQSLGFGGMILFLVMMGTIFGMLSPSKDTPPSNSPSISSEEKAGYDYAQRRFRQEGLSEKEAKQAADAVIKFNRLQNKR